MTYIVTANDRCGELESLSFKTFCLVPLAAVLMQAARPKACIVVTNTDRVDHDTNGLTDDQQERIDTALQDLQLAAALVSA